jgi:hypothetical protein
MHNGYPVTGRKRNWLLIILAVVLVSPLVLVMGAVFLIAVVAAIGGAARDQTSASPLQNVAPVSVGADHNGSDLNVNVNL